MCESSAFPTLDSPLPNPRPPNLAAGPRGHLGASNTTQLSRHFSQYTASFLSSFFLTHLITSPPHHLTTPTHHRQHRQQPHPYPQDPPRPPAPTTRSESVSSVSPRSTSAEQTNVRQTMSGPAGETAAAPSTGGSGGGFDLLRRATQAMMSK